MHIIVDGYNLIRQSDTFRQSERKSLEEGRNALLRSLAGYRKLRGHRITVVFDGRRRSATLRGVWRSSIPAWARRPTR